MQPSVKAAAVKLEKTTHADEAFITVRYKGYWMDLYRVSNKIHMASILTLFHWNVTVKIGCTSG
jgi:hypothetical protein